MIVICLGICFYTRDVHSTFPTEAFKRTGRVKKEIPSECSSLKAAEDWKMLS